MGTLHARVIAFSVPELEVACLVDTDVDRAQTIARELASDAIVTTELVEALEHGGIQACIVVTPTPTHERIVSNALAAGKHVLCEKPLTLAGDADERLSAAAADADLVLQLGFWRRFSPPWVMARRLLEEGRIGRPLLLRLSQWDEHLPPPHFHDVAVSGGLIVDCGVHEFDLIEWLTRERIVRVDARALPLASPRLEGTGDFDNAVMLADLSGGAVAIVDLSRNAAYADDIRTEVLGSNGAIFVHTVPEGRTLLGTSGGLQVIEGSVVEDAFAAGVAGELAAFARAVRGDDADIPGPAESSRALSIAVAATESARTGRRVDVP
jgi:predicted dehydrogenase